ncbi:hypothetical protein JB92DRAFT_2728297 [Gautieria morchelliformis]|nr:hypothetical protein JB92DRAFT_2728297 [Gautieria morchelliformis]
MEGGAGAAAVLYRGERKVAGLRYHLGTLDKHTMYEAEAIGVVLGLELLRREKQIKKATVLLDNQGVIQAITHLRPRPAQYIMEHIHDLACRVAALSQRRWINLGVHDEVRGNEEADGEAKKAAVGDSSQMSDLPPLLEADQLPHSLSAA